MSDSDKHQLRQALRRRRRDLPGAERLPAQQGAAGLLSRLPGWERMQRIAVYLAADAEFDPAHLVDRCRSEGRQLYLPVIQRGPEPALRAVGGGGGITRQPPGDP